MRAKKGQRSPRTPKTAPKPKTRGRAPKPKKLAVRIARNCHLTETEKYKLALRWALLPPWRGNLKKGVGALEIRSGAAARG